MDFDNILTDVDLIALASNKNIFNNIIWDCIGTVNNISNMVRLITLQPTEETICFLAENMNLLYLTVQNILDKKIIHTILSYFILIEDVLPVAYILIQYPNLQLEYKDFILLLHNAGPKIELEDEEEVIAKYDDINDTYYTLKIKLHEHFPEHVDSVIDLGNMAIKKNTYKIYLQCINLGYIPDRNNIICGLGCNEGGKYTYIMQKNMIKILAHSVINLKYCYKLSDLNICELFQPQYINSFVNLCEMESNEEYNEFLKKCYRHGVIIDIKNGKYNCENEYEEIYYQYYMWMLALCGRNYFFKNSNGGNNRYPKEKSAQILKYITSRQVAFRELFRHGTENQIKKYYGKYMAEVKYDRYCLHNAYLHSNHKIINKFQKPLPKLTPYLTSTIAKSYLDKPLLNEDNINTLVESIELK
jgi:hypothetical protein